MISIPKKYESKSKFINRCIRSLINEGTKIDDAQRVCQNAWNNKEIKDIELTPTEFILTGIWIKNTFSGKYSINNLPEKLYEFNYLNIMRGIGYGYGLPSDFMPKTMKFESALKYRQNISFFSGVKTFQMQSLLSRSVFNEDGTKRTFKEFNEIGQKLGNQYNVNYLRVEQNGAFRIAQSASEWDEIQEYKDVLPYIEYVTIGDKLVRADHAALNEILLPVNHKFWDTRMPPNDWGCRCRVIQRRAGKPTNLASHLKEYNEKVPKNERVKTLKNESKLFSNNAGKSGFIYDKSHPYFDIPKKYKSQQLENFGFRTPDDAEVRKIMKKAT